MLTAICQQLWIKRIWPKQWKESIYVPIPKKGDGSVWSNNRTIALLSHASKVMLQVIQHRLDMYTEQEITIEQAGFTKGRGTRDQMPNLRWIIERSTDYGCESWTLRKAERRIIDSLELWCWRRLLRIPWTARSTNKSVTEENKATNPLEALIKKQQLSYFGHIMRRENSLEKSIMLGMGGGTRKRGRPRARWLDYIKAVTKSTLTEVCGLAR